MKVIVGHMGDTKKSDWAAHIPVATKVGGWQTLIKNVTTPYVLVGRDLRSIHNSINFERSVRLLQNSDVKVVSGATKNGTGHWKTDCFQSEIVNYNLYIKPGYEESVCDCMICSVSAGAPFLTRTMIFQEYPLNSYLHGIPCIEMVTIQFIVIFSKRQLFIVQLFGLNYSSE